MKSAPFGYHAPETVDEAVALLEPGGEVRVLAGGQSLMTLMKLRRLKPRALVDINRVAGLDTIEERDGELVVGALVRQQSLLDDPLAARSWPLIRQALQYVGYRATRHRGTVGGSLAYAAAWAELTAVAVALDATIDARSQRGSRSIRAREFFRGPNETALGDDELITTVRFPAPQERSGSAFHEVSARYRDYAQVGAAAVVALGPDGTCTSAELVLLRVADTPHRADIDEIVRGTVLDEATLAAVTALVDQLDPPDDIEVSGTYRRRVAGVLARRALLDAAARATSEEAP
jgi:aerobic carbon-monoxide dehydrogenase medium subunit